MPVVMVSDHIHVTRRCRDVSPLEDVTYWRHVEDVNVSRNQVVSDRGELEVDARAQKA